MARVKLPYETTNFLSSFLVKKQLEQTERKNWETVYIKDIEEELASYCSLTRKAIIAIKRGDSQPSLSVAMKIAEFFDTPIHALFQLREVDNDQVNETKGAEE